MSHIIVLYSRSLSLPNESIESRNGSPIYVYTISGDVTTLTMASMKIPIDAVWIYYGREGTIRCTHRGRFIDRAVPVLRTINNGCIGDIVGALDKVIGDWYTSRPRLS